ncbi:MAG: hypothetical protein M3253_05885, partial [Chloroflexota bacterium]|nr:hypothetical protein [Chloroflexota bacterium]
GELAAIARDSGLLVAEINGIPAPAHPMAPFLTAAGFQPSAMGYMMRRPAAEAASSRRAGAALDPQLTFSHRATE